MSEKKDSVTKLFVERMTREGRLDEWKDTLANVQAETGQKFGQAKWVAMRRMPDGYVSPEDERRRHAEYLASKQDVVPTTDRKGPLSDDDVAAIIAALPPDYYLMQELEWLFGNAPRIVHEISSGAKSEEAALKELLSMPIEWPPSLYAWRCLKVFVDALAGRDVVKEELDLYFDLSDRPDWRAEWEQHEEVIHGRWD